MFGLGAGEIILILVVALIFIGPAKLPDLARSLGKGMREFRRAADDLHHELSRDGDSKNRTPPKPQITAPQPVNDSSSDRTTSSASTVQSTAGIDDSPDTQTPGLPILRPADDTIANKPKTPTPSDTNA